MMNNKRIKGITMRNKLIYLAMLLTAITLVIPYCLFAQQSEAEKHYRLGGSYMMQSNYSAAEKEFKQSIQADSKYALAYYGLGTLYSSKMGRIEDAILVFKDGISKVYPDKRLYFGLATTYLKIGDLDNSEKALKKILVIDPTDKDAHQNLEVISQLRAKNISKEEISRMFKQGK